jgi:hypothetical protein
MAALGEGNLHQPVDRLVGCAVAPDRHDCIPALAGCPGGQFSRMPGSLGTDDVEADTGGPQLLRDRADGTRACAPTRSWIGDQKKTHRG